MSFLSKMFASLKKSDKEIEAEVLRRLGEQILVQAIIFDTAVGHIPVNETAKDTLLELARQLVRGEATTKQIDMEGIWRVVQNQSKLRHSDKRKVMQEDVKKKRGERKERIAH